MEQIAETQEFLECTYSKLIEGEIGLHQLPHQLAAFYYLGESSLMSEVLTLRTQLVQANNDAERYYRAAARGGFGVPTIKNQGRTYAELQKLRGAA